jgi:hypothetical protein
MSEVIELLPGEGDTKTVVKTRLRRECDICGEPASYKHTFLLKRARSNPASSAYERDDCSWCEDAHSFVCEEHKAQRAAPTGHAPGEYDWCATFQVSERFAHLFLYWHESETK